MPSTTNRHRLPLVLRLLVLVLTLAMAPVGLGAESPEPSGRTSEDVADDLEKVKAEQQQLAQEIEQRRQEAGELKAMQNAVKGEITQTANALEAVNADLAAVREQIGAMTRRIEQVQAKHEELVGELEALDVQLADLVVREGQKQVELTERQALLADRLRAANDVDRTSLLEVFLSGGSFSDVLAEVSYHLDAGSEDKALADRIRRDQETLLALHQTVESTRTETNIVRQETAVQKKQLDAELVVLDETKAQLAELEAQTERELQAEIAAFEEVTRTRTNVESEIAEGQKAQADLAGEISDLVEEEAQRAEEEARRAAEEAARRAAEAARQAEEDAARAAEEARLAAERAWREALPDGYDGSLSGLSDIPEEYDGTFEWPLVGRISGEWGCSSYPGYAAGGPGCVHFHNGIDIVDKCGADIVAAGDGTVAYVGWNWADGPDPAWMVVIVHSTSVKTWYAHMTPVAPEGIEVGAKLKAGDLIGYEGNTGRSSGCHLHWMVELDRRFVNPRGFL
jgi:murein DD-endopeptidase MepM/ murein hydrolase activator NlpD